MGNKVHFKYSWQEVLESIKKRLENGEFSVGDTFYTIDELCQLFNVSTTTAKRVFQELKSEGWILPMRRRGTIVNRNHTKKNILFIVRDAVVENISPSESEVFVIGRLLEGLRDKEKCFNIRIKTIDDKFFFSHLKNFINEEIIINGELFYTLKNWFAEHPDIYEYLKFEIKPILLYVPEKIEGFSQTKTDYEKGIRLAVEYLIKQGHKRIAYLTGNINHPSMYLRFKGFIDTLRKYDLPLDINLIKVSSDTEKNTSWKIIEELLAQPNPPTAITCINDVYAIHIIEYCNKKGVHIPDDLAVIGFDNRGESEFSNPPLTTVDTQLRKQGEKAVELIMQKTINKNIEPLTIIVQPELIVRKST